MKSYQVFYWIKKNRHEYLEHMFVSANNAKEACRICKEQPWPLPAEQFNHCCGDQAG